MAITFNNNSISNVSFNSNSLDSVFFNDESVFLYVPTFSKACKYTQYNASPIKRNHRILVDNVIVSDSNSTSGSGTFYIDVNGNISATSIPNSRLVPFSYTFSSTFVREYVEQYMTHKVYSNVFNVTINGTEHEFGYTNDVNASSMGSNTTYMPDQTWTQNV